MNSRMAQMAILDCIFVKVVLNKFGHKKPIKDAE
jgi:DNA-binding MurR/RpiR family transcriptional regulator